MWAPGASEEHLRWWDDLQRETTTGENAAKLWSARAQVDVTDLAREITTPTLVLHARNFAAFPGNFLVRRWLARSARELLVVLGLGAAAITAAFGTVRPGLAVSAAIFMLLVLIACTRTVAGSAFALYVTPERKLAVMGVRASTGQLGYLLGAGVGGAALAAGGYPALSITLAGLFVLGAAPHAAALALERAQLASSGLEAGGA